MSELNENRTVADVAAFYQSHGRWPSPTSNSSFEKALGLWLSEQRCAHTAGKLDFFRRQVLDQRIPGWVLDKDDAWMEHARSLADHLLFKRSTPCRDAEDANERHIAYWLATQNAQARLGQLRPERRRWLDEHCPFWHQPAPPLFGKLSGGQAA